MGQMDSVHFCRFKSNSPGKLIGTVIIRFVHESFINVASDSSPGSDDALPAQMRRRCVLLQPVRLPCSVAAAWPISTLGLDPSHLSVICITASQRIFWLAYYKV